MLKDDADGTDNGTVIRVKWTIVYCPAHHRCQTTGNNGPSLIAGQARCLWARHLFTAEQVS